MSRANRRQNARGDCLPLSGAFPAGSGRSTFTVGNAINQAANVVRVATRYTAETDPRVTPWSYAPFPGQGPNLWTNLVRQAEMPTAGSGPRTFVATINAFSRLVPSDDSPASTRRDELQQSPPSIYKTRLQCAIEWGTGTGTNEIIFMDIDSGVVFRTYGVLQRIHVFTYPKIPPRDSDPTSRVLFDDRPIDIPRGETLELDVIQTSVQTSEDKSEGFPGFWKLTAGLTDRVGAPVRETQVPPFARFVTCTQSPLGGAIPFYEFVDEFGGRLAAATVAPGTRQTPRVPVPGGARSLRVPPASVAWDAAQAVWEVGQF